MRFVVPGRPVPKARPRILKGGGAYTPETTKGFEQSVWAEAHNAGVPYYAKGVSVGIDIHFFFHVETARTVKPRVGRPDLDNLIKAVCDGLQSFVYDDAQFVSIAAEKWNTPLESRTAVTILQREDGP